MREVENVYIVFRLYKKKSIARGGGGCIIYYSYIKIEKVFKNIYPSCLQNKLKYFTSVLMFIFIEIPNIQMFSKLHYSFNEYTFKERSLFVFENHL